MGQFAVEGNIFRTSLPRASFASYVSHICPCHECIFSHLASVLSPSPLRASIQEFVSSEQNCEEARSRNSIATRAFSNPGQSASPSASTRVRAPRFQSSHSQSDHSSRCASGHDERVVKGARCHLCRPEVTKGQQGQSDCMSNVMNAARRSVAAQLPQSSGHLADTPRPSRSHCHRTAMPIQRFQSLLARHVSHFAWLPSSRCALIARQR